MQGNNPVFNRSEAFNRSGGYSRFDVGTPTADELQTQYGMPSAVRTGTRMTINDVITKTTLLFAVFLAVAVPTFFFAPPGVLLLALIGGIVGTLVLGLVIAFTKTVRPPLILVYAAVNGAMVGAISQFYNTTWSGIVPQAILGTLAAFTAMLIAYQTGLIKVTARFRKIMTFAIIGMVVLGLVNLAVSVFSGFSIYRDSGPLGVLLSVAGVLIASLTLALDFDFIDKGIQNGIPERYSWIAAHGLLVTLVWLYLEILRLLSILRGGD